MDDHEAVKFSNLKKNSEAIKVVGPDFDKRAMYPDAAVPEGVDEVTLRRGEDGALRSCINTAKVEASRLGPPLVDADWHAVCQAIYRGVEGAEWENLFKKFVEMKEVIARHPRGSRMAKIIWKMRDANDRGHTCDDQSYATKIDRREVAHQELWSAHLKSPSVALSEALRRVKVWDEAGSSTAGASRT